MVDYLDAYVTEGGFDIPQLLHDDYFPAIRLLFNNLMMKREGCGQEPRAEVTRSLASVWICLRWSGPLKDSAYIL